MNCVQVLIRLLYGGKYCWRAASSAAGVDRLHVCGGVDELVRSQVWAESSHPSASHNLMIW